MDLSYRNIVENYEEAAKGKRDQPNHERIRYNLEDWAFALQESLENYTFHPSPLRTKRILFPKPRVADVPGVKDKTVQNMIFNSDAYYDLTRSLIPEASANTVGRGTDYARDLLKRQLQSFYAKYHARPWVLKADIHAFFASIPVSGVEALITHYVQDQRTRELMLQYLQLQPRGVPLGLRQSQALANLYLSELDHLVKEKWHFRYYGRHMDDFYILAPEPEQLRAFLAWLESYLADIGLELNPKTEITFACFEYLGFEYRITETGKVVMRMAKGKREKKNRHLRCMVRDLGDGKLTPEKFAERYFGWRLHALKGDTGSMVRSTDQRMNARLNKIGYQLRIVKHASGKVHWRAVVEPLGGKTCQEQSQI